MSLNYYSSVSGVYNVDLDWNDSQTDTLYTYAPFITAYSNGYYSDPYIGMEWWLWVDGSLITSGSGDTSYEGYSSVLDTYTARTIARDYGVEHTVRIRQVFSDFYGAAGKVATIDNTITVAARPYSVPTAPSSVAASRVSDTQASLSWGNESSAAGLWQEIVILRSTDGNTYTQIASITSGAPTATGYTDNTVYANHSYRYKVKSKNSAGSSVYVESGYIYNTPAAPSGLTATKTGASKVTLAWTDNANTESGFTISRTVDAGENWTDIGSAAADATGYVDSSAPGGTVAYRVKATRSTLVSAWSNTSNSVTTIAAPAAPTILNAWGAYTEDASTLRLSWQHNSLDGSAQSAADIFFTRNGVDASGTISSANGYYDIDISSLAPGDVVSAKVRTYGLHADPSTWSALSSTTLAAAPLANITTPVSDESEVADIPLTVAWDYTDDFAQVAWDLVLSKDGSTVKAYFGTTEQTCAITSEYLVNSTDYDLSLTVYSGSGLSGTARRSFATNYLAPSVPNVSAVFDLDTLSAYITGLNGADASGIPATNHLSLVRIETFHGTTETEVLLDPIPSGSTFIDYTPRLGQDVIYRVMAAASNGAYSYTDATLDTSSTHQASAFNFGAGYANVCVMADDAEVSLQASDDSAEMIFAGRPDPVLYEGEHTFVKPSFSASIKDAEKEAAVYALQDNGGRKIVFRDPIGYRCNAHATVNIDRSPGSRKISVGVSMSKVE